MAAQANAAQPAADPAAAVDAIVETTAQLQPVHSEWVLSGDDARAFRNVTSDDIAASTL